MQEHAQQKKKKKNFYPLPTPYHVHPLFFAKELHAPFSSSSNRTFFSKIVIGLIHRIRILRRGSQME